MENCHSHDCAGYKYLEYMMTNDDMRPYVATIVITAGIPERGAYPAPLMTLALSDVITAVTFGDYIQNG